MARRRAALAVVVVRVAVATQFAVHKQPPLKQVVRARLFRRVVARRGHLAVYRPPK